MFRPSTVYIKVRHETLSSICLLLCVPQWALLWEKLRSHVNERRSQIRNMAARTRLPLLFPKNLPPFRNQRLAHTEAAVKEPAYPPIIPSLTAKSKSARGRQVDEQVQKICASPVEEKISLITRIQRMKFVVYPQTFARNADTWYQHFTKTAYIPGLPEKYTLSPERETGGEEEQPAAAQTTVPGVGHDGFTEIRSLVTRVILQEHWQLRNRAPFLYRKQEQTVGPFLRNLVTGLTFSLAKYNPLFLSSSLGRLRIIVVAPVKLWRVPLL